MIVLEGFKHCHACDTTKANRMFRVKRHKRPNGEVCEYLQSCCIECQAEIDADRYQRRKQGLTGPSGRPMGSRNGASLYVRPRLERDCDAAFMGWRNVAQCVPVGAMLGARL